MASIVPINPKPFLANLVGGKILVRLKWGETSYEGTLVAVDSYMNLQLRNTEEFIAGVSKGVLGEILIRCNNVLYISRAAGNDGENGNAGGADEMSE